MLCVNSYIALRSFALRQIIHLIGLSTYLEAQKKNASEHCPTMHRTFVFVYFITVYVVWNAMNGTCIATHKFNWDICQSMQKLTP